MIEGSSSRDHIPGTLVSPEVNVKVLAVRVDGPIGSLKVALAVRGTSSAPWTGALEVTVGVVAGPASEKVPLSVESSEDGSPRAATDARRQRATGEGPKGDFVIAESLGPGAASSAR